MQSEIIAMLMPEGSPAATLLVRRADGQFFFERVDARVAQAARVAASWSRRGSPGSQKSASALIGRELVDC